MNEVIISTITAVVTAAVSWFFARRKNELDIATAASAFYQNLLDDAAKRLDTAIQTIDKQDVKIKMLIEEVERLTDELKKYKQLNGKQP